MKSNPVQRTDLPALLASFNVGDTAIVAGDAVRQEALRIAKQGISFARRAAGRRGGASNFNWRLRTWSNGDGTYSILAVEDNTHPKE